MKHAVMWKIIEDCPQCGCSTETLYEGYCDECAGENQRELDEHNALYDQWRDMSDEDRESAIRAAL